MIKPKYLSLKYDLFMDVNIEELEIDWPNVVSYSVKYDELYISYADKTHKLFKIDIHQEGQTDWSHPKTEKLFDAEREEISLRAVSPKEE